MKIKHGFILSILFALSFSACKKEYVYTDVDGNFSVNFHDAPTITVDSFDTELGKVRLHSYMSEISLTKAQMVTYSDYPVESQYIKDPYDFIKGAKEGALSSLGIVEIEKDERIELNGIPGVDVMGNNGKDLHMHYKLFLFENRMYQIGFLKEGELGEKPEELEFMESFVFLNN